jgi:hypothetical protein
MQQNYQNVKDYIESEFVHWVCGAINTDLIIMKIEEIIGKKIQEIDIDKITYSLYYHSVEWLKLPIDSEGATPLQDKQMDEIISKCANEIHNIVYAPTL